MPARPSPRRRRRLAATAVLGVLAVPLAILVAAPAVALQPTLRTVRVLDDAYDPATLTITVGDTVEWVFEGENPHSVFAPGRFDSHPSCSQPTPEGCAARGETFAWEAAEPGEFTYVCRFHGPSMSGQVVVEGTAEPTETGAPSPPPTSEPSPSPSPEPSPTSSPRPSPAPSPTPSPEEQAPSSSPRPSPSPSPSSASSPPRPAFGPPPARDYGPLPTITPTASPSPAPEGTPSPGAVDDPDLEEFPAPGELDVGRDEPSDDVGDDEVEVAVPGGGDDLDDRTVLLAVAGVALTGTIVTFGRVVLFGDPWT